MQNTCFLISQKEWEMPSEIVLHEVSTDPCRVLNFWRKS